MIRQAPTNSEIKEAVIKASKVQAQTRFGFLREINGLRTGGITGILGTTGSGKSTLTKTMILDTAKSEKVFVWLSEEEAVQYMMSMVLLGEEINRDNIVFFMEQDIDEQERARLKSPLAVLKFIKERILESESRFVFFDNFTTSGLYSDFTPSQQSEIVTGLNNFCKEFDICLVAVLHTRKDVNASWAKLIEGEDVRGSAQAFQQAIYFFVLQGFRVGSSFHNFVTIKKSRINSAEKQIFKLTYKNKSYVSDVPCTFEEMNSIFKLRNILGVGGKRAA